MEGRRLQAGSLTPPETSLYCHRTVPGDVTAILLEARAGNREALDRLFPLVYDELRNVARRRLAAQRADHRRVVELWRDAEPELRNSVEEARRRAEAGAASDSALASSSSA